MARRSVLDNALSVELSCSGLTGVMGTATALQRSDSRKCFTREDYHAMGEAGILAPEERVELVEGEVIVMSPIGNRHAACVGRLTNGFAQSGNLGGRALVWVQNPLAESDVSEPQPDLMLLIPRDDHYDYGHPAAADVLLLVEVADSSLDYDLNTKVPFYARAGIREVWIVDLEHDRVEVHTEPSHRGYGFVRRFVPGDVLAPSALPEVTLEVASIIPARRQA